MSNLTFKKCDSWKLSQVHWFIARGLLPCDSVDCHRQQLWVESSPTWLTIDGTNAFMQSPEPSVLPWPLLSVTLVMVTYPAGVTSVRLWTWPLLHRVQKTSLILGKKKKDNLKIILKVTSLHLIVIITSTRKYCKVECCILKIFYI